MLLLLTYGSVLVAVNLFINGTFLFGLVINASRSTLFLFFLFIGVEERTDSLYEFRWQVHSLARTGTFVLFVVIPKFNLVFGRRAASPVNG